MGEPAQGVDGGGLLCYFRMMLWLNTCMSLLLPVAMTYKLSAYLMLYAKDNTKEQYVVFGYKHTLWDSESCALMV